MSEIKITRTDKRILFALDQDGDMTPRDLADSLGLEEHVWISRKLARLRGAELVRVSRYIRNTDGRAIPVYSITPGENAKRPKPQGWAVWSRNYRKRLKGNGGEQYLKARNSLALLVRITA